VAREGQATITIEFEPGWDMARAADDVKTRVDAITELPEDADDPTVRRGAWRDRVTDIVITGPLPVEQLGRFADELSTRLFAAGVTRVSIRGLAAPQTVVEVDEAALIGHDVTLSQIAAAIRAEAEADPAGDVAGGTARVRTGVEKRSSEEIAAIVLRAGPDGSKLRIGDVARIRVDGPDRERAYFAGPDPALSIRVDRSEAGDAIEIQQTVEQVAAALQADLPQGVTIELIRTRAEAITTRIGILLDNGMLGLMLVVTLLFLFLNARTAFWVAAGIPVAMLATIALMYAAGLTLNMISLFRADHHAGHRGRRRHRGGRTRRFPCPAAGRAGHRRGRQRRPPHGAAGVFGHRDDGDRLLRAGRGGWPVRRPDQGHPVYRDHRADRLADRMLPDPAQPHGPCAEAAPAARGWRVADVSRA
jgi:multidrug efflux pump subunit AcrB